MSILTGIVRFFVAFFSIGLLYQFLHLFGVYIPDWTAFFLALGGIAIWQLNSAATTQQGHSTSPTSAPPPSTTYNVDEAEDSPPKRKLKRKAVASEYIQLELDLDANTMTGIVLKGPYATRKLEFLSLDVLIELWRELASVDPDGFRLLDTYLDRNHPKWRDAATSSSQRKNEEQRSSSRSMSPEEAYDILGLKVGASVAEIKAAHRNLQDKNHPDHGGSNRLAALINEARAVLLGDN
jgi:hypothetical protein